MSHVGTVERVVWIALLFASFLSWRHEHRIAQDTFHKVTYCTSQGAGTNIHCTTSYERP